MSIACCEATSRRALMPLTLVVATDFYGNQDMAFDWDGDGITASSGIPDQLGNYEFSFFQENSTSCSTPGYVNGTADTLRIKVFAPLKQ